MTPVWSSVKDQRWDIRVNSWRLSSIIASTLFSQSVRFSDGRKYRNICSKSVIGCGPNHLKSKTDFRMRFGFHEEYQKCKIHKKIESESWFKSFFTPSCILNCIKMLYFCIVWLIRYAFIPSTWQVQTWVSSGFKGIWFQISKVKFFKREPDFIPFKLVGIMICMLWTVNFKKWLWCPKLETWLN